MNGTLLIACSILRRELELLSSRHAWGVRHRFINAAFHADPDALGRELTEALGCAASRPVVCYGVCHPWMDRIVSDAGGIRTPALNCVELLLGTERYSVELANGSYFLLEEWAIHWDEMTCQTFGDHPDVVAEIFRTELTSLLAIRTPCSGEFRDAAEAVGRKVGLPVRWLDVPLDHLEQVLAETLATAERGGYDGIGCHPRQ